MKKNLIIFISCFICVCGYAQNYAFDWVNVWSETDNSNLVAETFTTDSENNLFVVGRAIDIGLNDFDPSDNVHNITSNNIGAYITKFNTYGELQWATLIESSHNGSSTTSRPVKIQDIKINGSGEIYVTGYFLETLYFEGSTGAETRISNGGEDIFFGKLNPLGEWEWIKTYGDVYGDQGKSIVITDTGEVLVTGFFAESVQFDPDVATPSHSNWYDMFILKFDNSDQLDWVYTTDFTAAHATIEPISMTIDSANSIYVTGRFSEWDETPLDFDTGPSTNNLPSSDTFDTFLLKLDNDANFLWAKSYASTQNGNGYDLAIDSSNNIVMSAMTSAGTLDLDSSIMGEEITATHQGGYYVLKLTPNGTFMWVKLLQPQDVDNSYTNKYSEIAMVLDHADNVFIQGTYDLSIDIDPGLNEFTLNKITGATYDSFLVKLDANGDFIQGQNLGTSSSDRAFGLDVDSFGNVYGALRTGYLASDYSIDFGNLNYTVSGNGINFFYKITNCDQELVHDLGNGSFYADATNATYQWLDCDNGNAPIAGETNRTFTTSSSGNYALQATNYSCVDTSPCFSFGTLSVDENTVQNSSIYPNPTKDILFLDIQENINTIEIFDLQGKKIFESYTNLKSIDVRDFKIGLYIIRIKSKHELTTMKFIKF